MAYEEGLDFDEDDDLQLQHMAGRVADILTQEVAHELGLPLSEALVYGAAAAEKMAEEKLQWLLVFT
jgi:hypothetical protein